MDPMQLDWMPRYLDWLGSQQVSQSTRALYEQQLSAFLRWLSDRGLELKNVGPPAVRDYLRDLRAAGYRDVSALGVLKALQRFAGFALETGIVSRDPTQGLCRGCLELRTPAATSSSILRRLSTRPAIAIDYRLPIFGPSWERYVEHRLALGYSRQYILQTLNYNFHFHRYLAKRGIHRLAQVNRGHLDAFLKCRKITSRKRDRLLLHVPEQTAAHIEPFLRHALPDRFVEQAVEPESRIIPKRLMDRYLHFGSSHRGYRPETQRARCLWVGKLGFFLDAHGLRDLGCLKICHLDDFMREQAERLKPRSLHSVASSLRCFLRYLFLRGTIPSDLARQVASPVRFRADLRPKYLPWKKVEELLSAIDRGSLVGKRDYAMVFLMAHHGLRSHEVAGLKVADIDFEGGSIALSARKGGTSQQLPILAQTREALRDYLSARPASGYPEVFLRVRAPRRPLGGSIKVIVGRRLLRHLGASVPRHGAHLLRHSFAKALLDRGAKLHDIGGLLGHRHLESTLVYTRVATEDLREVVDNYAQLIAADHASPPPGPVGPRAMRDTARRQSRSTGRHREIISPPGKEVLERKA